MRFTTAIAQKEANDGVALPRPRSAEPHSSHSTVAYESLYNTPRRLFYAQAHHKAKCCRVSFMDMGGKGRQLLDLKTSVRRVTNDEM